MANTSELKKITEYAVNVVANDLKVTLIPGQFNLGIYGAKKRFDGISLDRDIVVKIINHSGYTSGGKLPVGKIKSTFADCYFLSLTKANMKILALTNKEYFYIFQKESYGLLNDIVLKYIELPDDLMKIAQEVARTASAEMS